jgi:23S rRNA (pseudouridine1915-N3)-methyltransferase
MNVEVICIGSLKEPWLKEAEKEYIKRLSSYVKINITELNERRLTKNPSPSDEDLVRKEEGEALLHSTEKYNGAIIYTLDMRGKQFTSEGFAKQINEFALIGKSTHVFLIGGSLGLPERARQKADIVLSFSEMTFPHQMMRIILLEQLYRTQKILRGEPYHK